MFPSYHPPPPTIQLVGALRQAVLDVLVARLRIVFGGLWEGEQAWRGPGLGLRLGLRVRVRVRVTVRVRG